MTLGSLLRNRMLWIWTGVWAFGCALMVVQVGYWNDEIGINYQDVEFYKAWSDTLANYNVMPDEESWQYPPGAAFVLLAPRIGIELFGTAYQPSFVAMMLLVYLVGFVLLALLARRTGRNVGVWVWLLAIPLLQANPLTRFDLVPTVLAMAALVAIQRRPVWFGALVGIGASIKVWPVVLLLGEWDRRRLAVGAAAAAAAVALTFLFAGVLFGDQSGFFGNQGARGLQKEAVAAVPWYARWTVTGEEPQIVLRSGSAEVGGGIANAVAVVLKWLGLLVLLAAALWWVARDRAIRRGRTDLADASLSRDFVFTVVLLQIVVSRVLSPQFMIWLIGLAAIVLSSERTRLARPAWIAIGAAVLTTGIYLAPANMMIRNLTLIVAAVDAAVTMFLILRDSPEKKLPDGAGADRVQLGAAAS